VGRRFFQEWDNNTHFHPREPETKERIKNNWWMQGKGWSGSLPINNKNLIFSFQLILLPCKQELSPKFDRTKYCYHLVNPSIATIECFRLQRSGLFVPSAWRCSNKVLRYCTFRPLAEFCHRSVVGHFAATRFLDRDVKSLESDIKFPISILPLRLATLREYLTIYR
jgi:hypothetical protein